VCFCYYKVICYAWKATVLVKKPGNWWRTYCHFKANENLVINNNNCPPSLSDCSQGEGKQGILLCWPNNTADYVDRTARTISLAQNVASACLAHLRPKTVYLTFILCELRGVAGYILWSLICWHYIAGGSENSNTAAEINKTTTIHSNTVLQILCNHNCDHLSDHVFLRENKIKIIYAC